MTAGAKSTLSRAGRKASDLSPEPTATHLTDQPTVYTDNSVCVVYVNDVASYTSRIYGIQKNCWSIDCYGGGIAVSNVEVRQY